MFRATDFHSESTLWDRDRVRYFMNTWYKIVNKYAKKIAKLNQKNRKILVSYLKKNYEKFHLPPKERFRFSIIKLHVIFPAFWLWNKNVDFYLKFLRSPTKTFFKESKKMIFQKRIFSINIITILLGFFRKSVFIMIKIIIFTTHRFPHLCVQQTPERFLKTTQKNKKIF